MHLLGNRLALSIWPTLAISLGLLALAAFNLYNDDHQAISGAIVGYLAAYWLPAVRVDTEKGGPRDG